MRVLEYGRITEEEMVCDECGTRFAYCPRDVEEYKDEYRAVVCPLCGKVLILNK